MAEGPVSVCHHKIMVLARKGGVGKSCATALIARKLVQHGFQVGLLDANLCCPSIPSFFGLDGRKNQVRIEKRKGWLPVEVEKNLKVMSVSLLLNTDVVSPMAWRSSRKTALIEQFMTKVFWGTLDFLLIDMPPDISEEHMAITRYMQREGADGVVLVTTPAATALQCVGCDLCLCQKMGLKVVGVIENKVTKPGCAAAAASTGRTSVIASIPLDSSLDESNTATFSIRKPSAKVDAAVEQLSTAITKSFDN